MNNETPNGESCQAQPFDLAPTHPAATQACKECPFRKSNQNRPSAAEWFDPDNYARMWRDISRGSFLGCHIFDSPELTGYNDSMGALYHQPTNIGGRKECAGAANLIHREIEAAREYPTHAAYIEARPTGLQPEAWQALEAREIPLTEPANLEDPDILDPADRINTGSLWWKHSQENINQLVAGLKRTAREHGLNIGQDGPCDCRVCANHAQAHQQAQVTTAAGETVDVDAELQPVLTKLAARGILTTGSCQDLHDAMQKLWPEQIPVVLSQDSAGVGYAEPVATKKAVIRFKTGTPAATALIGKLNREPWATLTLARAEAQISFHMADLEQLSAAIGDTK